VSVNNIYSWQSPYWDLLLGKTNGLPHAMLFVGPSGIGKSQFADAMAARLLCEKASGVEPACGKCDACHWLGGGNHPDYRRISFEDDSDPEAAEETPSRSKKKASPPSTQIKIHQIRALDDFVFVGSHRQGNRVVVIEPADAMNIAAANSLLKMLEEPPSSVYFIMISSKQRRLLPTLRSRCRQIVFGVPERTVAEAWLKEQGVPNSDNALGMAGGAPLRALEIAREGATAVLDEMLLPLYQPGPDPLMLAAQWEAQRRKTPELSLELLVDTVQKWLCDLVRVAQGQGPRYLVNRVKEFKSVSGRVSVTRLNRLYADLLKIRATARHPLNELLFLEDLAARCASVLASPRTS
jgi:DNA polymerase-3 subunit delta'